MQRARSSTMPMALGLQPPLARRTWLQVQRAARTTASLALLAMLCTGVAEEHGTSVVAVEEQDLEDLLVPKASRPLPTSRSAICCTPGFLTLAGFSIVHDLTASNLCDVSSTDNCAGSLTIYLKIIIPKGGRRHPRAARARGCTQRHGGQPDELRAPAAGRLHQRLPGGGAGCSPRPDSLGDHTTCQASMLTSQGCTAAIPSHAFRQVSSRNKRGKKLWTVDTLIVRLGDHTRWALCARRRGVVHQQRGLQLGGRAAMERFLQQAGRASHCRHFRTILLPPPSMSGVSTTRVSTDSQCRYELGRAVLPHCGFATYAT